MKTKTLEDMMVMLSFLNVMISPGLPTVSLEWVILSEVKDLGVLNNYVYLSVSSNICSENVYAEEKHLLSTIVKRPI